MVSTTFNLDKLMNSGVGGGICEIRLRCMNIGMVPGANGCHKDCYNCEHCICDINFDSSVSFNMLQKREFIEFMTNKKIELSGRLYIEACFQSELTEIKRLKYRIRCIERILIDKKIDHDTKDFNLFYESSDLIWDLRSYYIGKIYYPTVTRCDQGFKLKKEKLEKELNDLYIFLQEKYKDVLSSS